MQRPLAPLHVPAPAAPQQRSPSRPQWAHETAVASHTRSGAPQLPAQHGEPTPTPHGWHVRPPPHSSVLVSQAGVVEQQASPGPPHVRSSHVIVPRLQLAPVPHVSPQQG